MLEAIQKIEAQRTLYRSTEPHFSNALSTDHSIQFAAGYLHGRKSTPRLFASMILVLKVRLLGPQ